MTVQFTRNGKVFTGKVVSRGFHKVDMPECFEIEVARHAVVFIPVTECKEI